MLSGPIRNWSPELGLSGDPDDMSPVGLADAGVVENGTTIRIASAYIDGREPSYRVG